MYALWYSITREYFHEQLYMESINLDAKLLLLPQWKDHYKSNQTNIKTKIFSICWWPDRTLHVFLSISWLPQGQPWTLTDVNNYLVSLQSKCSVRIESITFPHLKPFRATVLFLYPLKTSGFRILYGGKEGDQRYEMV